MDKIHACWRSLTAPWELVKQGKKAFWRCEACDFRGDLEDAVGHIVKNQFIVRVSVS